MASNYRLFGLVALPLAFGIGCGAGDDADRAAGDADAIGVDIDDTENVATAVSALCSDSGIADVSGPLVPYSGSPPQLGGHLESTSPDALYGSAACSDRYVLEATDIGDTTGFDISAFASWADFQITSQAQCEAASVDMIVYRTFAPLSTLIQIGQSSANGHWNNILSLCTLSVRMPINASYVDAIRVAAKASWQFTYGRLPGKVRVGVEVSL